MAPGAYKSDLIKSMFSSITQQPLFDPLDEVCPYPVPFAYEDDDACYGEEFGDTPFSNNVTN